MPFRFKPADTARRAKSLAGAALFAAAFAAHAQTDLTVAIIRHGEKPALGLGQLTCQGLNRSLALPSVLLSRYGTPAALYAPDPSRMKMDKGISYAYIRPLATIEPLAIRAGLPVDLKWGMTDIEPLAEHLIASNTGTHVVAWEHHWGESLARLLMTRLGGDAGEVPKWADDDFDSIFVIRLERNGGKPRAHFSHEHEGLDGLPAVCTGISPAPAGDGANR